MLPLAAAAIAVADAFSCGCCCVSPLLQWLADGPDERSDAAPAAAAAATAAAAAADGCILCCRCFGCPLPAAPRASAAVAGAYLRCTYTRAGFVRVRQQAELKCIRLPRHQHSLFLRLVCITTTEGPPSPSAFAKVRPNAAAAAAAGVGAPLAAVAGGPLLWQERQEQQQQEQQEEGGCRLWLCFRDCFKPSELGDSPPLGSAAVRCGGCCSSKKWSAAAAAAAAVAPPLLLLLGCCCCWCSGDRAGCIRRLGFRVCGLSLALLPAFFCSSRSSSNKCCSKDAIA